MTEKRVEPATDARTAGEVVISWHQSESEPPSVAELRAHFYAEELRLLPDIWDRPVRVMSWSLHTLDTGMLEFRAVFAEAARPVDVDALIAKLRLMAGGVGAILTAAELKALAPRVVGTCATCGWAEAEEDGTRCTRIIANDPPVPPTYIQVDSPQDGSAYLYVAPDFGCVLWEGK